MKADGFFYPLALSVLLETKPIERRLAGRRLVLFRGADRRVRVFDAECPHHGANLADGKVIDGHLACPYHGWRFDGAGRCVHVPAQPDCTPPAQSSARAHEAIEQQGVIWVRMGGGAAAEPPLFPAAEERSFRRIAVEQVAPGPADWWLDNFMDIAHVPFVHPKSFGGRTPAVTTFPVERRADNLGFAARVVVRHEYGLLARLLHGTFSPYTEDVRFTVTLPAAVYAEIEMGRGRRQALALLAAPEDAATTRVIQLVWRNYLKSLPGADAIGRQFVRRILREDAGIATRSVSTARRPTQAFMAADGPALELGRLLRLWRAAPEASIATVSSSSHEVRSE